jgi:hypothetical protein
MTFPEDWFAGRGRVVLTGEYGGMAGFRQCAIIWSEVEMDRL